MDMRYHNPKTNKLVNVSAQLVVLTLAPVAYQVIPEPGIGQFREFEPPRVHTRINSWGLFFVPKLSCGKRENVS